MEFTIVSVIVFGSITMCLVLLLNLAEKKLLPQGDVSILINDEPNNAISVGTGGTLSVSYTHLTLPTKRIV